MVNTEAISRDDRKLHLFLDIHKKEKNIGVQLIGDDPKKIGKTCKIICREYPYLKWLNLNCGCPSPRTMKCGGGSAMLAHPKKITDSIIAMKRYSNVPVSIKIRIKKGLDQTVRLCRSAEQSGVDFIIIHGRTQKQGYSGVCNWELIRSLKQKINVPIIGNGDIQSASQGKRFVKKDYCDGFMIGRAAMTNPMVFSDKKIVSSKQRFNLLKEYLEIYQKHYKTLELNKIKLKALQFINNIPNAARIRKNISSAKTMEDLKVYIK